jgi:hypothetical protein
VGTSFASPLINVANPTAGNFRLTLTCTDADPSTTQVFAYVRVVTDTAVTTGAGTLQDWYIPSGTSPTYNIGQGVFVEPDFGQTVAIVATNMPASITFNPTTKIFTGTSVTNVAPFVNRQLTVTLTATDSATPANTATKALNIFIYETPTCTPIPGLNVVRGV